MHSACHALLIPVCLARLIASGCHHDYLLLRPVLSDLAA
jgi:hypothetical protein